MIMMIGLDIIQKQKIKEKMKFPISGIPSLLPTFIDYSPIS